MAAKKPSPKKSTAKSALSKKKKRSLSKVDVEKLDQVTGGKALNDVGPVAWVVDRS